MRLQAIIRAHGAEITDLEARSNTLRRQVAESSKIITTLKKSERRRLLRYGGYLIGTANAYYPMPEEQSDSDRSALGVPGGETSEEEEEMEIARYQRE